MGAVNSNFLHDLIHYWDEHTVAMVMIRDIVMYLDRVYVTQRRDLETVHALGLQLFRDYVLNVQDINAHLRATMLSLIALERKKEAIDW